MILGIFDKQVNQYEIKKNWFGRTAYTNTKQTNDHDVKPW